MSPRDTTRMVLIKCSSNPESDANCLKGEGYEA